MGTFTISFGNTSKTYTTNLSAKFSKYFSHIGTNLNGCVVDENSISVKTQKDYKFVLKVFDNLAKGDNNLNDITDKDFETIQKNRGCGAAGVAKNIWHKHGFEDEYMYHSGNPDNPQQVGPSIWLASKEDDGV